MSWTSFAIAASILGLVLSSALLLGTVVAPQTVEEPFFFYVLFAGVFLAFVPAVTSHPSAKRTRRA